MNKHTDTTRPVDAPTDHAARYARHVLTYRPQAYLDSLSPSTAARIMRDAWSGNPDTDRYWAHNND